LSRIVGDASGGVGRLPLRADAIRFQAGFERSNEQVRARWFPHRAHLFDADFSAYPEEEPAPFTAADAIRVSAELWRRSAAELRRLEAEIVYRDGRIARLKKRHDKAESCFRRALELDPSHAQASAQLERVLRISAARRERRGSRFWRFGALGRGLFP
jgi:tetratricopeptide (TPR) repeat protein